MAVGSLIIQMAVDLARFRSDMGSAAQISNARLREIERSTANTMRQISTVGRSLQSALGAAGIGASLAGIAYGLKSIVTEAINFGDEMEKAALKTGLQAGEFANLANAASLVDVELGALSKGMRTMLVRISEASDGNKTAIGTFTALGLSVERLSGLKADQQLELIADAIASLKDPADRARAGTELFSRSWEQLAPFLLQGSAGIREARQELEKIGAVLSNEDVKKLADAEQAVKELGISWRNLARTLVAEVSPALKDIAQRFTDLLSGSRASELRRQINVISELEKETFKFKSNMSGKDETYRFGGGLLLGLKDVRAGFYTYDQLIKKRKELEALLRVETRAIPPGGRNRQVNIEATGDWPDEGAGGKDKDKQELRDFQVTAKRLWDFKTESDRALAELNQTFQEDMAEFNREMIQGNNRAAHETAMAWQDMVRKVQESFDAMSVFAEQAGRSMQTALADFLFDPFSDGLRGMLAGFVNVIRRMAAELMAQQALMSFFGWASGKGGLLGKIGTDMLKGITRKAAGGPVNPYGAYLVGENGPELLRMGSQGGTITPNNAMGGFVFAPVYNIDAKGADAERIMAVFPPLLQQSEERTLAKIRELNRRGRLV